MGTPTPDVEKLLDEVATQKGQLEAFVHNMGEVCRQRDEAAQRAEKAEARAASVAEQRNRLQEVLRWAIESVPCPGKAGEECNAPVTHVCGSHASTCKRHASPCCVDAWALANGATPSAVEGEEGARLKRGAPLGLDNACTPAAQCCRTCERLCHDGLVCIHCGKGGPGDASTGGAAGIVDEESAGDAAGALFVPLSTKTIAIECDPTKPLAERLGNADPTPAPLVTRTSECNCSDIYDLEHCPIHDKCPLNVCDGSGLCPPDGEACVCARNGGRVQPYLRKLREQEKRKRLTPLTDAASATAEDRILAFRALKFPDYLHAIAEWMTRQKITAPAAWSAWETLERYYLQETETPGGKSDG